MDLEEFVGSVGSGETDEVMSVIVVSSRIKTLLEGTFRRVSVEGDVTGFKPAMSGHVYFSLAERDAEGSTQKLDCVIYRFAGAGRAPILKDGDRVVATGRPEKKASCEDVLARNPLACVGAVTGEGLFRVRGLKGGAILEEKIEELKEAWQRTLRF